MKTIYLFFVLFLTANANAQNLCTPTAFLEELAHSTDNYYQQSEVLCPAGDGNLFVIGSWGRDAMADPVLMKVSPLGEVFWSRKFLKDGYSSLLPLRVKSLVLDSEGMLIISGNYPSGTIGGPFIFVVRYDPVQDTVLWGKYLYSNHFIFSSKVLEKQPGGNYLLCRIVSEELGDIIQFTEILEMDRLTGVMVSTNSRRISLEEMPFGFRLTEIVPHQGALYAIGTRVAMTTFATDQVLCRLDSNGTQMVWANTGYESSEKILGVGLVIDQDTLVSVSYTNSYVYLRKTSLDGQLLWTQRYEVSDTVKLDIINLIAIPSGYLILGVVYLNNPHGGLVPYSNYMFLTTDKAGHLQHTLRLPNPGNFQRASNRLANNLSSGPVMVMDESLYMVGGVESFPPYNSELLLLKSGLLLTDLNNCPFDSLDTSVVETTLPAFTPTPISLKFLPITNDLIYDLLYKNLTFQTIQYDIQEQRSCVQCEQPCGPTLSLGPDQEFFGDTSILLQPGAGFASYLWQDSSTAPQYLAAAGGTYWLEVKDNCDIVQRDTIHLKLTEAACVKKDLSCISWELLELKTTPAGNTRFQIRLTNNCTSALRQVVFKLPNGVIAAQPANESIYTSSSSSRTYTVRNPSFSPYYSIRFRANSDELNNGSFDVFTYELPGQSIPAHLYTSVKLMDGSSYDVFLNTSNCIPELTVDRTEEQVTSIERILSPNPTAGKLWLRLPNWKNQLVQVRIFNTQGQVVQKIALSNNEEESIILLSPYFTNGLYHAVIEGEHEAPLRVRFVLAR